jgi:hypothetical protein
MIDELGDDRYAEAERVKIIQRRMQVLKEIVEHFDIELSATHSASPDTFG